MAKITNAEKSLTLIAALACLTCSSPAQAADTPAAVTAAKTDQLVQSSPVKDKWALIVGISKFADPALNLKYAAKDAQDFSEYLINEAGFAPDHVKLLTNEDATREAILDMLGDRWLPHAALPGDLVVIFISSHGSPSGMDVGDVNYVIAYNTDKERLFSTGLSLQELIDLIKKRVHSDRIIAVLDTCFSGAAGNDSKALVRTSNINAEQIAQGTGQLVICSSEPTQVSWESKNYENGVFTRRLIEGLRLKGKETTLDEAFAYMQQKVQEEVVHDRGALQAPVLKSKWQGARVMLAVPASSPRQAPYIPLPLGSKPVVIATPVTSASSQQIAPLSPAPTSVPEAKPELSWETWFARVKHARQLAEHGDKDDGQNEFREADAVRQKMGTADPRLMIDQLRKKSTSFQNIPPPLADLLAAGKKSYQSGDLVQAESSFRSAISQSEHAGSSTARAASLDGLGVTLLYQEKYKEAQEYLQQAKQQDDAGKESPRAVGLHLEHLAAACLARGNFAEATKAAKDAVAIWEKEPGGPQLASALNILGAVYLKEKKFPEAESSFKRALAVDDKTPWYRFPDKSQTLYNLALLSDAQNNHVDAEVSFKKALAAREKRLGTDSVELPIVLYSMATNSMMMNKRLSSETALKRALTIEKKVLSADHALKNLTARLLFDLYKTDAKIQKADLLAAQYPAILSEPFAQAEKAKENEALLLFSLKRLNLSLPSDVGEVWVAHLNESFGDTYGKWIWDSSQQVFRAEWDNGDSGVVRLSRYEKGRPVMHFAAVDTEVSGYLHAKESTDNGFKGWSGFYDLIGVDGHWEAYW